MSGNDPEGTPEDMDLPPLNEWVVDELTRTRDALSDLMHRHENILNHLTRVCRRNDAMQAAGNEMAGLVAVLIHHLSQSSLPGGLQMDVLLEQCHAALKSWGEANV